MSHSHCECSCGCSHEHHHKEKKLDVYFFIISVVLFVLTLFLPNPFKTVLAIAAVALSGYETFIDGIKSALKFDLNEKFLLTVAVVAAFILGETYEAVAVTVLFSLGEKIEHYATKSSQKSIDELTKITSKTANRILSDKSVEVIDVKEIAVGDILLVKNGEKVPVDCEIISGSSSFDTSAITGESIPRDLDVGDTLYSGSINLESAVECRAVSDFDCSTVSKIIELVKMSNARKSNAQKIVTRFAKIYTPTIMVLALMVAILPPILFELEFKTWIYRALVFLVASCPCAIVISIPLAFFSAIGRASKNGIFIKGSRDIEALSKVDTFVFDKTGTLTSGEFSVTRIEPTNGLTQSQLLNLCANAETYSNHPIAKAIVNSAGEFEALDCQNVREVAGQGVIVNVNGREVGCGNKKLMDFLGVDTNEKSGSVYISLDGVFSGVITVEDTLKKDTALTLKQLKKLGIRKTVMLTGDTYENALKVKNDCEIDEFYSSLLPEGKSQKLAEIKSEKSTVAFVGDGINDAPVLALSDIGIAVGNASDIASDSADVVLVSNSLSPIIKALKISRNTMNIVRFNFTFAILFKVAVLVLDVIGLSNMWLAVVADVGVTIVTSLLSISIFRKK